MHNENPASQPMRGADAPTRLTLPCPSDDAARFLAELAGRPRELPDDLQVDFGGANALDYLSVQGLLVLARECRRHSIALTLAGLNDNNLKRLRVAGVDPAIVPQARSPQIPTSPESVIEEVVS